MEYSPVVDRSLRCLLTFERNRVFGSKKVMVKEIMEKANIILHGKLVPDGYWMKVMHTAIHLLNRSHIRNDSNHA